MIKPRKKFRTYPVYSIILLALNLLAMSPDMAHAEVSTMIDKLGDSETNTPIHWYPQFNTSCPVIYDNDDPRDTYTDEYLMSLASLGKIDLRGIITTSSIAPYNKWVSNDEFEMFIEYRSDLRQRAIDSGYKHIPDTIRGVKGHLIRPASGAIGDTIAIDSPGSRLIRDAAREATPEHPLIIIVGGPLTTVADAYLLDPSISDRIIVSFLDFAGRHKLDGYNPWSDGWATTIVFQQLNVIRYLELKRDGGSIDPQVPKQRIWDELPKCPLTELMFEKQHPSNPLPDERDVDCAGAISLVHQNYVLAVSQQSYSHETRSDDHMVPVVKDNPDGNILLVTKVDRNIATNGWWETLHSALKRQKINEHASDPSDCDETRLQPATQSD